MEVRDELQPLLGLTDSHAGHGTFVTGLIMQTCPDAKVLSLRMLHSDGYSTEGAFLVALDWLRRRVIDARSDDDLRIDVVSLSLGFYPETADPAKVPLVRDAITRLTDEGVVVVAAAGNDATTRTFLPAAFGEDNALVAAVGALNAAGDTVAAFSNAGTWIGRWAPGNALVSTVPVWQGARGPAVAPEQDAIDPVVRTSPDDDDLTTGFAMWAGTSFATPVIAGKIGCAMLENQATLAKMSPEARARELLRKTDAKLADLKWPVRLPAGAQ
jgi:subtilisin family serine protease